MLGRIASLRLSDERAGDFDQRVPPPNTFLAAPPLLVLYALVAAYAALATHVASGVSTAAITLALLAPLAARRARSRGGAPGATAAYLVVASLAPAFAWAADAALRTSIFHLRWEGAELITSAGVGLLIAGVVASLAVGALARRCPRGARALVRLLAPTLGIAAPVLAIATLVRAASRPNLAAYRAALPIVAVLPTCPSATPATFDVQKKEGGYASVEVSCAKVHLFELRYAGSSRPTPTLLIPSEPLVRQDVRHAVLWFGETPVDQAHLSPSRISLHDLHDVLSLPASFCWPLLLGVATAAFAAHRWRSARATGVGLGLGLEVTSDGKGHVARADGLPIRVAGVSPPVGAALLLDEPLRGGYRDLEIVASDRILVGSKEALVARANGDVEVLAARVVATLALVVAPLAAAALDGLVFG
ncbi:MAG TPA: hypothetical protein VHB21_23755 [Minicystis sp.]|nr:hypothetical protein [Minicystis sp.]